MSVRQSPWPFVATVGGVGIIAWALTVFFVFAYPLVVVPEALQPTPFVGWFDSVITPGGSLIAYGVLLLVTVGGYYLVRTRT